MGTQTPNRIGLAGHGLTFSTTGSYTTPVTGTVVSPFTIRRELGQLSLLYIPGS